MFWGTCVSELCHSSHDASNNFVLVKYHIILSFLIFHSVCGFQQDSMIETSTFAVSEGISLLYKLVLWSERLLEYFIFFREARKPRLLHLAVVEYILLHTYCVLNWSPSGKQKSFCVLLSSKHEQNTKKPKIIQFLRQKMVSKRINRRPGHSSQKTHCK